MILSRRGKMACLVAVAFAVTLVIGTFTAASAGDAGHHFAVRLGGTLYNGMTTFKHKDLDSEIDIKVAPSLVTSLMLGGGIGPVVLGVEAFHTTTSWKEDEDMPDVSDFASFDQGSLSAWGIGPHVRVYFMTDKWRPFVALSGTYSEAVLEGEYNSLAQSGVTADDLDLPFLESFKAHTTSVGGGLSAGFIYKFADMAGVGAHVKTEYYMPLSDHEFTWLPVSGVGEFTLLF
ncbi:MAG: hypothetical protein P9L99_12965 [Candidatus Lernaella stagnicola]|nr:hypothetical protein [Candidatus Lernaella stagnicola]